MGKVEIKGIRCGFVNCYLLKGESGSVLVDTGSSDCFEQVERACEGEELRLIALTHGHSDHTGNAAALARRFHVPIAMSGLDKELLSYGWSQPLKSRGVRGRLLLMASKKGMKEKHGPDFTPDIELSEGDSLSEYGVDARVVGLGGHTLGSVGFVFDGGVIVGDALFNVPKPGSSLIYHDKAAVEYSARKISELGSIMVYFGHGKPVLNRRWI